MELITSLILLVVLIVPPFFLAGRELLTMLFFDKTDASFDKHCEVKDSGNHPDELDWETASIYDGMITVEIPVSDDQVVAYDPVLEADLDDEPEIIIFTSRASNA